MRNITTIPLPPASSLIIDFEVSMTGEWLPWTNKVPQIEVETHKVASPDIVVPTLDTGQFYSSAPFNQFWGLSSPPTSFLVHTFRLNKRTTIPIVLG